MRGSVPGPPLTGSVMQNRPAITLVALADGEPVAVTGLLTKSGTAEP